LSLTIFPSFNQMSLIPRIRFCPKSSDFFFEMQPKNYLSNKAEPSYQK